MSIFDTSTDVRRETVSKTLQYRGAVFVVEHVVTHYYRADGTLGGLSQSPVYSVYGATEDEDGVVTKGEFLDVATGDVELETMLGFFKKGGQ